MVNEASQISAAGDITGTVGHYEQSNPKGNEYITEEGTATSYSRHHKKGWDTTNIREAKYKNTKVNPKDVPVAVYGGHVENSKSDTTVDASLLNSMSQLSTNPNTSYVIETDPNFTNRRNFLSSDYVLSRLKLDPMNIQKRLGDGYYEQQLVMQEIMRQTGKSRLQSGLSAEEQYRQLMDAGISVTKSQSIVLGRGLTEAEQKNLKEDVVLLVSKSVVLPNGKTETVLVPTLYLAPNTKRVEGGANLQAQSINLSVDTMHNSGSIIADKDVTLTGNSIHNDNGLIKGNTATVTANDEVRNTQGTIMGNDTVSVYAKKDVVNEGGTITQTNTAGSTKVVAGRDVINKGVQYEAGNSKVEWNSSNNRRETITGVDQGRIGGAGQTTVVAGRDVSMEAGIVSSDVNTTVTAGRNVTMKAMNATHELEEHRFDKGKSGGGHSQTTESHDLVKAQSSIGSSIEGKNVSVVASDAVQLEGSQVLAADTVKVSGNTVALNTAKANSTVNHVYLDKKKSLVKRESTNAVDDVTSTSVTGSTVSGKDITITSTQDVTGQSAQILGENTVSVTAGGKVELGADKDVTDGSSVYRHKKSGLLGGAGIGFSIGKEKHNIDEANHEEATVRSTIASTKGTVNIEANDTVHLTSADIVAKEGAVLDGSAVTLDGNVDHNHMTHDERYKKTGLTVSLGGAVANTLTNTTRTIKQAGGRDDKRLAALELNEARKQLQDGYEAVDAALHGEKIRDAVTGKVDKVDGKAKRGAKNIDDAINLSVSIGSTSRKQGQVVDTNTYQGGTLVSDGNVHIKARDAQQSGIGLTGETVEAKKLVLDSASDINLEAGKNTVDVNNTYKSSGWSVGAGISLTGGGLLDINASGHMARQNGDIHQESYVLTKVKAAQLAQLKAKRDTNIIGSTVSGKKVEVDTGRDLHIQSLQDVDNFKEHSKSAGFSVSSKPNFKNPTGSINASVGRIDSKWKSVTEQAGIYAGEEGYNINVGNNTTLEGAVIKSEAPKAKNKLTTKSLEMKDIKNEAEYTYSNNGIGYNYYGSKKKLEEMKTKDKKGYDKIYNNIGLVPNLGVGSKGKASSTTQSAISDGILTVDGKEIDTKTINTNTENTLHQLDKIFDKKKIEERQELARLFSKNMYEQLHNWEPKTPEDLLAKSIAHGVIGELAARIAGNSPGNGFKATMTNELLSREIIKLAKNDPALAQWLSSGFGAITNFVLDSDPGTGAAVTSYATKWNLVSISSDDEDNEAFLDRKNKEQARYDLHTYGHNYQEFKKNAEIYKSTLITMVPQFRNIFFDISNPTKFEFIRLAEEVNLTNPLRRNGAYLKMNINDDYENQLEFGDKGLTLLAPRTYRIDPNSQLGLVVMDGKEMKEGIRQAVEHVVNQHSYNTVVKFNTGIRYQGVSEIVKDIPAFVSVGTHEINSEGILYDDGVVKTKSLLVDNSNYEYRGSLRPDDILNDIGARGMELDILKKYQIRIPFNIEAIPIEKFKLENNNARRVGDRYIKTASSIATIKLNDSKDIKPSVNNVINKINELLTEGGRHVTIYNKYRGRNEEYVIQVKSQ